MLWCCFPPAGFLKCPFWCYLFVLSACGINSLLLIHLSLSLSFFFRLLFSPLFLCMFFLYSVPYSEELLLVGSFSSLLSPILSITDSRKVLKMNISRCEVILLWINKKLSLATELQSGDSSILPLFSVKESDGIDKKVQLPSQPKFFHGSRIHSNNSPDSSDL